MRALTNRRTDLDGAIGLCVAVPIGVALWAIILWVLA